MLWLFVGPMGFTCWISFAPVFSFIYESPESPRIVFLFYSGGGGGGFVRFHYFFSPIVMFYESVPIQIRCRYDYSGNRLNSAGIAQEFNTISKTTLEHAAWKLRNHLRIS